VWQLENQYNDTCKNIVSGVRRLYYPVYAKGLRKQQQAKQRKNYEDEGETILNLSSKIYKNHYTDSPVPGQILGYLVAD
jgi:hypothetical protein